MVPGAWLERMHYNVSWRDSETDKTLNKTAFTPRGNAKTNTHFIHIAALWLDCKIHMEM